MDFPLLLVQHPYDEHQDDLKIDILIYHLDGML